MSVNSSYLAETALIDLSFALAEISLSETTDAGILRAAEHIKSALSDWPVQGDERSDSASEQF
jgi:hypothetical protein